SAYRFSGHTDGACPGQHSVPPAESRKPPLPSAVTARRTTHRSAEPPPAYTPDPGPPLTRPQQWHGAHLPHDRPHRAAPPPRVFRNFSDRPLHPAREAPAGHRDMAATINGLDASSRTI